MSSFGDAWSSSPAHSKFQVIEIRSRPVAETPHRLLEICMKNSSSIQNGSKSIGPARIAVDIGGTFTDIALDTGSSLYTAKTPTTQDDPVRGVIDVIRIASNDAGCTAESIGSVIHGTTHATNALIERKGARVGLITTAGFRATAEQRRS
jgi:hypothetical protein